MRAPQPPRASRRRCGDGVSDTPPVVIGAFADAERAAATLGAGTGARRAAVLPRAAVSDGGRLALRDAGIECLTTLEGGGLAEARGLARELAEVQGWRLADGGADGATAGAPGDLVGWYELRIARALTTDRPITRLHGARQYIASFNLLGQGRLNQRCGELLYERLMDEGIAPEAVFDIVVCSESKAVGMAQVLVESFGGDRYVVLRKGLKNYMPRAPRGPLVEEASSITTTGAQSLVLDPLDWALIEGRRVLLVDDVIATGGTVRAAHRLLDKAGATVAATAAILLKGPAPPVSRLVVLARPLPLTRLSGKDPCAISRISRSARCSRAARALSRRTRWWPSRASSTRSPSTPTRRPRARPCTAASSPAAGTRAR